MKRLLTILGVVFCVVIVFIAIVYGFIVIRGSTLDKESKAYVDRNVPLIFGAWDEQALLSRASPEFMQATSKKDLDEDFAGLSRKLGKMHAYEGSEGSSDVHFALFSSHNDLSIRAVYTAKMVFDGGQASVVVSLIKHGDQWQIAGFNIDSDVLLKR